jgi:hypothetical protein
VGDDISLPIAAANQNSRMLNLLTIKWFEIIIFHFFDGYIKQPN